MIKKRDLVINKDESSRYYGEIGKVISVSSEFKQGDRIFILVDVKFSNKKNHSGTYLIENLEKVIKN